MRVQIQRIALAVAAIAGVLLMSGADAAAQRAELPVNVYVSEISANADRAVAAYERFDESHDLADYLVYAQHRTATARFAARELGYQEWEMIDAWKSAPLDHQRAVLTALTQVGVPYVTNASVEDEGFDCSGLTLYAWAGADVDLDRISSDQIQAAEQIDRDEALPGDLVFWPGHIMMYLGIEDAIVHSINTGRTVEVDTISTSKVNRVTFGDPDS